MTCKGNFRDAFPLKFCVAMPIDHVPTRISGQRFVVPGNNVKTIRGCMRKLTFAAAIAAGAFTLAGCAGTGNDSLRSETEASVSTKIVDGKTTKDEVRSMFGSPLKTEFTDGGLEIWHYELTKLHSDAVSYIPVVNLLGSSASGKKKELVVLFSADNIVKRYSMSESAVSHKTGIFN